MKSTQKEQPNFVIDIDGAIEIRNKKNPDLKEVGRQDVADASGFNKQVFSDYKGGKKKPPRTPDTIEKLGKVCEFLGVSFNDLIVKNPSKDV